MSSLDLFLPSSSSSLLSFKEEMIHGRDALVFGIQNSGFGSGTQNWVRLLWMPECQALIRSDNTCDQTWYLGNRPISLYQRRDDSQTVSRHRLPIFGRRRRKIFTFLTDCKLYCRHQCHWVLETRKSWKKYILLSLNFKPDPLVNRSWSDT